MTPMRWIFSIGAFFLAAHLASAGEPFAPACACGCKPNCHAASACCLPPGCYLVPGSCLSPGCCEQHRHCCDNAWDGYCEQRAHWDSFWCKVGTGAFVYHAPCASCGCRGMHEGFGGRHAACQCQSPAVAPAPPAVPAPSAVPVPSPAMPAPSPAMPAPPAAKK